MVEMKIVNRVGAMIQPCLTPVSALKDGDSRLVVVMPTSHASASDWLYVCPVPCRDSSVYVQ